VSRVFKLDAVTREVMAGWLLVPYVTWVSFATVLNFTLWRLNR
jgi:translocator protein